MRSVLEKARGRKVWCTVSYRFTVIPDVAINSIYPNTSALIFSRRHLFHGVFVPVEYSTIVKDEAATGPTRVPG